MLEEDNETSVLPARNRWIADGRNGRLWRAKICLDTFLAHAACRFASLIEGRRTLSAAHVQILGIDSAQQSYRKSEQDVCVNF